MKNSFSKKMDLVLIIIAIILCGVLFLSANKTLDRYDEPTQINWVNYKISKDMYLWELATELADKFNKDPQMLIKLIGNENRLGKNFFLKKGDEIGIPQFPK